MRPDNTALSGKPNPTGHVRLVRFNALLDGALQQLYRAHLSDERQTDKAPHGEAKAEGPTPIPRRQMRASRPT